MDERSEKYDDEALPPNGKLMRDAIAKFAAKSLEEQVQILKDIGIFDEKGDFAAPYRVGTNGTE